MSTARALSIRAPYWWLILHAGKDIENRDWPTRFRGKVYIHASKWWKLDEVVADMESSPVRTETTKAGDGLAPDVTWRQMRDMGGCIVGSVDIVDCVSHSSSPWFFGDYGFVLSNPVALARPIPCKGSLGLFAIPDDILQQMREDGEA